MFSIPVDLFINFSPIHNYLPLLQNVLPNLQRHVIPKQHNNFNCLNIIKLPCGLFKQVCWLNWVQFDFKLEVVRTP